MRSALIVFLALPLCSAQSFLKSENPCGSAHMATTNETHAMRLMNIGNAHGPVYTVPACEDPGPAPVFIHQLTVPDKPAQKRSKHKLQLVPNPFARFINAHR